MPAIGVNLTPEPTPGLTAGQVIHCTSDWELDALEHGMRSGRTSLMLRIPVDDPEVLAVTGDTPMWVYAETSLKMWVAAARALAGAFHDELDAEEVGWIKVAPAVKAVLAPRFAEAIRRACPIIAPAAALEAAEMVIDSMGADAP